MPVITFKYQDLKDLGIDMEKDELIDTLPMMASDIEDYDDEEIKVEFFVAEIRPFIRFARIEGVDFTGDKIKYIMDFQENLHWVIGRDRKKVAIGVHNADVISGPYKYIATPKDENSFVPLEMDEEMTPDEILKDHAKGEKYAHLIDKFDKYPLIIDKDEQVLSMPPIINGELTKLKEDEN